jgi:hypothetical protein
MNFTDISIMKDKVFDHITIDEYIERQGELSDEQKDTLAELFPLEDHIFMHNDFIALCEELEDPIKAWAEIIIKAVLHLSTDPLDETIKYTFGNKREILFTQFNQFDEDSNVLVISTLGDR